ncbi:MAG: hypothetical protein IIA60_11210, partial [Candidatus Marinimicrobia bacterium]|nr:hypothetical protein [Candidatus Neomarinimicrobiota bacterium]
MSKKPLTPDEIAKKFGIPLPSDETRLSIPKQLEALAAPHLPNDLDGIVSQMYQLGLFVGGLSSMDSDLRMEYAQNIRAYHIELFGSKIDRLKVLLDDLDLVRELGLQEQILRDKLAEYEKNRDAIKRTRSNDLKLVKILAVYPLMWKLKQLNFGQAKRLRILHKILVDRGVPGYGGDYFENKLGYVEEIDRLRKWDDGAMKWY